MRSLLDWPGESDTQTMVAKRTQTPEITLFAHIDAHRPSADATHLPPAPKGCRASKRSNLFNMLARTHRSIRWTTVTQSTINAFPSPFHAMAGVFCRNVLAGNLPF